MESWPKKDPDEVVDYQFVWTERLEDAETISSSTWLVAQGDVVIDSTDITLGVTTAWVSGGTNGVNNVLTNRIETSGGRTWERSARLRVRSTV